MTIREVKNSLIHKIVAIHDVSFLNAIKTIVDTPSETTQPAYTASNSVLTTLPLQKVVECFGKYFKSTIFAIGFYTALYKPMNQYSSIQEFSSPIIIWAIATITPLG